jgi:uncharacterized protein
MIEEIVSANKNIVRLMNFGNSEVKDKFDLICDTKASVFNVSEISKRGDYIVFNTLCNSLFRFSAHDFLKMLEGTSADLNFRLLMLKNGFWVKKDIDELKLYFEYANKVNLTYKRPLNLTVTTTLKCNARCKYCYEKGVVQKDFLEEKFDGLIELIKNKLLDNNFDGRLKLNIFGGEPFMNEAFIDKLCKHLSSENIEFISYIITNGSLLDNKKIEKLIKWNVKDVQITLDGTAQKYAELKNYVDFDNNIFDDVIENIKFLSDNGIFVHIRMNISRNNICDIMELASFLNKEFDDYKNVTFYPAFLMETADNFSETEKVAVCYSLLKTLTDLNKIPSTEKFFSMPRIHSCMKGDPNSFVVDVDGNIFACEHDVGIKTRRIGSLDEFLLSNEKRLRKPAGKCFSCAFIPKCFGGCAAAQENGEDFCFIEKYMIKAYMKLF